MFRPIYRLMSGRKARGLGSGKTTGSASHAARQRNLKQKFVSLLKKFKVTDPEELDQEQATLDQKISGKKNKILRPKLIWFGPLILMGVCIKVRSS